MMPPRLILEINTRVWLPTLGIGESPAMRDVPDDALDRWLTEGFDAVWLMGIWQPSMISRNIALDHPGLLEDYRRILTDWSREDVIGSPYAVAGYQIPEAWGGGEALADLRKRMNKRGLRLVLDFVPNHTACDHPWVREHPGRYVQLAEDALSREPESGFRASTTEGDRIIAHGKDPYFPPWTDTAQLDYRNPELHEAQIDLLQHLAEICDGVRCDVAMLILPEVFDKTWGGRTLEFWERAIREVKAKHPDFTFIAETYWGLDRALNDRGFDLTYDKELLDHMATDVPVTRQQFDYPVEQHRRRLRFLENHDEPRVASRMEHEKHAAAATWLFSLPSSTLVYDGELEGRRLKSPIQLRRDPVEETDIEIRRFYDRLLAAIQSDTMGEGEWTLLVTRPAWLGNGSYQQILGQGYDHEDHHLRIFVNWSAQKSQCWVDVGLGWLQDREVVFRDQLGSRKYVRQGTELMMRGLYLDLQPWETHVFSCEVRGVT